MVEEINNYQSRLEEIKKKQNKIKLVVYSFVGLLFISYFVKPNNTLNTSEIIFSLIIFPGLLIFGMKYFNDTQIQIIKNAESVMYLYNEIIKKRGFDTSRYYAVKEYYENTILKYDKNYHKERKQSSFGFSYLNVENDLQNILENVSENEIELASYKYEHFNEEYIRNVLSKLNENKNYQNKSFELKQYEDKKWDKLFDNLAKGQGVSKKDLYDEMEEKEKLLKTNRDLLNKENEKIDEENRQNSSFVLTTGLCPFCKSKISNYVTKCPVCTGDIVKERKR